jgi:hypothetical protein
MTAEYYGGPVVREGGDKNKVEEVERNEVEKWRNRKLGWRNGARSPGVTTVTTEEVVLSYCMYLGSGY